VAKKADPKKAAAVRGKTSGNSRKGRELVKAAPAGKKTSLKKASAVGGGASKGSADKKAKPKFLMSAEELEFFRGRLLDKRREIIGDMNGIEAEALGSDRQEAAGDISDHPADAGTDNFEQEFSLGLLESERQILAEINDALARIDDRTYGVCVGTGKPIGKSRLEARPWSKYCIDYARLIEKGLVQPGDSSEQSDGDDDEEDRESDSDHDVDHDREPDLEADSEGDSEGGPDGDEE
jgi:RNA polymerase-binding protein DksA